ncbi:putative NIF system FeS cluster assembly, NifU, Fe-S cluster assembly domain superfamily [Helianthus annuus]|nr:putative NIF system FeS cluster assembly, NifU, Fe-S cluster assembly domain superfamily [Helianthus annuus]KAJ0882620.1 putative NIF system FeS cluster assembly, NifU, Fe-S cluster assembly domain superfamily [Helianthus annuus]
MAFAASFPMSHPQFQPSIFTNPTTRNIPSPSLIVTRIRTKRVVPQSQRCTTTTAVKSMAGGGLYSAQQFDLTPQNVDTVLDDVRPYLIADGGNVDVVSVQDGVVSLKLQGACESCPSSTTTMKMGIERILKEKFGDAIKDIVQVYDQQPAETTVEAVNAHLDILRPAIANFGGNVEVLSVKDGECVVKYTGPESIGSGVKAAIKEKFTDVENVVLTE